MMSRLTTVAANIMATILSILDHDPQMPTAESFANLSENFEEN
jgi:hypothetical protein